MHTRVGLTLSITQARRNSADSPILRTVGQANVSDPAIFWMVIQFRRSMLLDFLTNNYQSEKKTFHVAVMHKWEAKLTSKVATSSFSATNILVSVTKIRI